jgi:hypothetical protein
MPMLGFQYLSGTKDSMRYMEVSWVSILYKSSLVALVSCSPSSQCFSTTTPWVCFTNSFPAVHVMCNPRWVAGRQVVVEVLEVEITEFGV